MSIANPVARPGRPLPLALSVAFALLAFASPAAAEIRFADDLPGWVSRILEIVRQKGAAYDSLTVAVDPTAPDPNRTARVEIKTHDRAHQFGSLIALAAGPSDLSRSREKIWSIRFPVALDSPVVDDRAIASTKPVAAGIASLRERLTGLTGARLRQIQLERAQPLPGLAGFERVPVNLTLLTVGDNWMNTLVVLSHGKSLLKMHSIQITPVKNDLLVTFGATILVRSEPVAARLGGDARRLVSEALERSGCHAETCRSDTVQDAERIEFEAMAPTLTAGWDALQAMIALPNVRAFQILELRQVLDGRLVASGLLYFPPS